MDDMSDPARPRPADLQTPFAQVPIEITISVGRARPRVRDQRRGGAESRLPLDRRVDAPVEPD